MHCALKHLSLQSWYIVAGVLYLLTAGTHQGVAAEAGALSPEYEAKLILKAITYNKNIPADADRTLTFGISYFNGLDSSKQQALLFYEAVKQYRDKKVAGLPLSILLVPYNTEEQFRDTIAGLPVDVLYITTGPPKKIRAITKVTRLKKILSCGSTPGHVVEDGVTLAIGALENLPKVYVNLSAAQQENIAFGSQLLHLA